MLLQRTRSAVAKAIPAWRREADHQVDEQVDARAPEALTRDARQLGLTNDEYQQLLVGKRRSLRAH